MLEKGAWTPQSQGNQAKSTPGRDAQSIGSCRQIPFLNSDPFLWWYGVKNVPKGRVNGESCMALLDNSVQINRNKMAKLFRALGELVDKKAYSNEDKEVIKWQTKCRLIKNNHVIVIRYFDHRFSAVLSGCKKSTQTYS